MSSSHPIPYDKLSESDEDDRFIVAEPVADPAQQELFDLGFPARTADFPQIRFMGSKYRLLPWIHTILSDLTFESAADAFSGSGCVGYLFKAMGKRVVSNDFLNLGTTLAKALIENPGRQLSNGSLELLLKKDPDHERFIEKTFSGIFYTPKDLRFLDKTSWNIRKLTDPHEQAIARAALIRSCAKRQPRGVFTISGDLEHYKDGRRDLKLSLREHFLEQVQVYNAAAFDNGQRNAAHCGDVFDWQLPEPPDLVYMDPPYVPRADDNCYMKRYHFLEGLSCYWEGKTIMPETKVKKIEKPFTPFSYRKNAVEAFDSMFRKFADSTLVLSYSSNGYPDLAVLHRLMRKYKRTVEVFERAHRYHFGTHKAVKRAQVKEYLIIGV
jgi:DNA adenine methylase/adenine-specific DNA-methyltransferase